MVPFRTAKFLARHALVTLAISVLIGCDVIARPERKATLSASEERGAALYTANCLSCHVGATGGTMTDLPPRHNANGHTWHHADCQITDIILNGSGEMGQMMRDMMGGKDVPPMPTFKEKLTEEEVAVILAYIKTWWTQEQREWQVRVTQVNC